MNKPKYFLCELDLFFYRRGAEGTEEERKESNLKSPIPYLKLIPVRKKKCYFRQDRNHDSHPFPISNLKSKISNLKWYDYPLAPVITWKNLGVYFCKRLPAASVNKVAIVNINK